MRAGVLRVTEGEFAADAFRNISDAAFLEGDRGEGWIGVLLEHGEMERREL